jgi:hypothetical protein
MFLVVVVSKNYCIKFADVVSTTAGQRVLVLLDYWVQFRFDESSSRPLFSSLSCCYPAVILPTEMITDLQQHCMVISDCQPPLSSSFTINFDVAL